MKIKKEYKTQYVNDLMKVLINGVISENLKQAVDETIKAIKVDDIDLAYHLTACKSLIADMKSTRELNTFLENTKENEKRLGKSVYKLLDCIHHDMAHWNNSMPSGMVHLTTHGIKEMTSVGEHPIVKRIIFEKEEIYKKA